MAQRPGDGVEGHRFTRRGAPAAGLGVGAGAWALGSGTAHAEGASQTTFDPTGLQVVTGTNVQDALEQVDERLEVDVGASQDAGELCPLRGRGHRRGAHQNQPRPRSGAG